VEHIMSRTTITFALFSALVLGTGACNSSLLEPAGAPLGAGITDQPGTVNPSGDDRGGLTGGHGADDPANHQ
jgi:hypothetical protein